MTTALSVLSPVAKAINDVPGVLNVRVDYGNKQAVVSTDGPAPVGAIVQGLEKAGYRGSAAENEPPHPGK